MGLTQERESKGSRFLHNKKVNSGVIIVNITTMKRFTILFVALFASVAVFAQQAENYIQVNGFAEKEVIPNEIYLAITLDESDSKGRQAIELQRKQMISALKAIGIDTNKSLSISDLSSSYYKRGTSLAVAQYQLKLSTSQQVIAVYDALGQLGISNINIVRVTHTDIERLKSECRKEAMVNARTIASELAEAVGQSIGDCIYIYDSNRGVTPTYYNDGVMLMRAAKSTNEMTVEEPVEFKKIKLSYSVTTKFTLNGK